MRDLHVAYGAGVRALQGVRLGSPGELVALVGANGAGKTTLLKAIAGLVRRSAGESSSTASASARCDAPDRVRARASPWCRRGAGCSPASACARTSLLGTYIDARSRPPARDARSVYALFPVLRERADQRAGTLSGGEAQMLAIARALMSRPRFLMLDEPSLGIMPRMVDAIFERAGPATRGRLTILLVEQNVPAALDVADRGLRGADRPRRALGGRATSCATATS